MSFDLGDPIPLAWTVKDPIGAAANATTVVLTITLPDGTSSLPALTNSSAGHYQTTVPYIASQSGIHRVSWLATGTNAQAQVDVFNVIPADPRMLISLAEARTALGTVATNVIKDEDLRGYISAATPIMEDICGAILPTTRTETYDGGSPIISLAWSPVVSITSITESQGGTTSYGLTAESLFTPGGTSDAFAYSANLETGTLVRRASGVTIAFAPGRRNVQVVYVSGRTVVRPNIILATRRLVRHLWQSEQQGFRPAMSGPDQTVSTPTGFAVPRAVIEMAADDQRLPGLA